MLATRKGDWGSEEVKQVVGDAVEWSRKNAGTQEGKNAKSCCLASKVKTMTFGNVILQEPCRRTEMVAVE